MLNSRIAFAAKREPPLANRARPRLSVQAIHRLVQDGQLGARPASPASILGPIMITIAAGVPDRRRRDVDNLGKAVLDLLTAHQVIEVDAKVMSLTSRWDKHR